MLARGTFLLCAGAQLEYLPRKKKRKKKYFDCLHFSGSTSTYMASVSLQSPSGTQALHSIISAFFISRSFLFRHWIPKLLLFFVHAYKSIQHIKICHCSLCYLSPSTAFPGSIVCRKFSVIKLQGYTSTSIEINIKHINNVSFILFNCDQYAFNLPRIQKLTMLVLILV